MDSIRTRNDQVAYRSGLVVAPVHRRISPADSADRLIRHKAVEGTSGVQLGNHDIRHEKDDEKHHCSQHLPSEPLAKKIPSDTIRVQVHAPPRNKAEKIVRTGVDSNIKSDKSFDWGSAANAPAAEIKK